MVDPLDTDSDFMDLVTALLELLLRAALFSRESLVQVTLGRICAQLVAAARAAVAAPPS